MMPESGISRGDCGMKGRSTDDVDAGQDMRAVATVLVYARLRFATVHMLSSSARHFSQLPQPSRGKTMRRSPTFTPFASGPSFTTRPTTS